MAVGQNAGVGGQYAHLTTAANYLVKGNATSGAASPGLLHGIVVGTGTSSGVITIYDGISAAGAVIGVINAAAPGNYSFNVWFNIGLFVVVSGATIDATVSFA